MYEEMPLKIDFINGKHPRKTWKLVQKVRAYQIHENVRNAIHFCVP